MSRIMLGGVPVVGFGEGDLSAPTVPPIGPWKLALTTSVLGAFTSWALEEVAQSVRGKNRR